MFRELLAWLIPRRRQGRRWAMQATEASTHELLSIEFCVSNEANARACPLTLPSPPRGRGDS
jgi:hypothetical protein